MISAQQVNWWTVQAYVAPLLETVDQWPTVGTPEWCAIDGGPVKLAAIYDAARHWALRLDALQEARAEAGRAISGSISWSSLSHEIYSRTAFFAERPWLRRAM